MATIRLRPLDARPVSAGGGVTSRHDLSFGAHYDPARTAVGPLVAHNDDVLDPGTGYGEHDHRDIEIVTWVARGRMTHHGPDGRASTLDAGTVQRISAGRGWCHDEVNDSVDEPLHLVQFWLLPVEAPGEPVYETVHAALEAGRPTVLAGPAGVVGSGRSDAVLTGIRLAAGTPHRTASAPWVHAVVVAGDLRAPGATGAAGVGDVLEVQDGALDVVAGEQGVDLLVWTLGA